MPAAKVYKAGETLSFTVNFSKAVTVTGAPTLTLDIGGAAVNAAYVSGDNTSALVFAYTVVDGNTDANGIDVSALGLNGGTIKDTAGNNASLTLNSVGSTAAVLVDTTAPTVGGTGTIGVSDLTYNSAKLTWTKGTDDITLEANLQYKVVYSTSSITTVAAANALSGTWIADIATATVTGLTANTDYYFNVLVKDQAGNMALYSAATGKTTVAPSSGGTSSTPTTPSISAVVEVNGQKQDAGTASTQTTGGQTVTTIKVDDTKLDKILASSGEKPTVTLPTNKASDVVVGELNGQTVKNMEQKEAVLEIKTSSVTYTLPATQINIDDVSSQIGAQIELKDIKVSVKIAEPPADTVKIVENTAAKNSYQIVVKPVEFEITCTSGSKTVAVSKFNGYVERTVAIPDGIDPSKITTGIVLNNDGTFSHVPTQIVVINGKYYAKINSLTNSTYSVIYNPVAFTDVAGHWAKDAVNNMGSRMVVTGIGNSTYEPDRIITRAEFAAIVVRALGLRQGTNESSFGDVTLTNWFNGYVDTAASYSLIAGYNSTTFAPNDTITREQAMTILARAMKLTGLSVTLTDSEVLALLSNYTDAGLVSDYAKAGAAACIKNGVVSGTTASTLSPKDSVTRAEVAVMVQRLLEKSRLI
ncbi:hypothetical protein SDC9_53363 [bioreactor metagenome]|uniref:Uncharacterized protein n=1 Tax=bioreactor metagenome TaxID=1076179 RepID=A0A644WTL0_9ZZZZ